MIIIITCITGFITAGKYQTCNFLTSDDNFIRYLLKHLFCGLVGLAIWTPIDFEGAYHMLFKGNGQSNTNVKKLFIGK